MKTVLIDKLVWIYIFLGLFAFVIGIFIARQDPSDSNLLGGGLMLAGGISTVVGVVLFYVRSRMPAGDEG